MFKSLLKFFLAQFYKLIARLWIAPLDNLIWETIGLDQSSPGYRLRTLVVWIKDVGRLIYSGLQANVSRWDGAEWSVVYFGDQVSDSKKELKHLLFSETPTEKMLGRAFIWQLPALIRRSVSQGDLVVCDLNRLLKWRFQSRYYIRVFPWMRALLDISAPMGSIRKRMSKSRRQDLAKIKKYNYRGEISRDPKDFERFYHKMYVPFISGRHQDRALVRPKDNLQDLFARGNLMFVKHEGVPVAAGLGVRRRYGGTFSAMFLGVDQDHFHLLKKNVLVALCWQRANWARAEQLRCIDFGRNRARLSDGIFTFKRRWGMRFERDVTSHTMWTFIGKDLPSSLIHHLSDLAFVAEVGRESRCVVFAINGFRLSDQELALKERSALQAGLDGLLLVQPHGEQRRWAGAGPVQLERKAPTGRIRKEPLKR